MNSNIRATNPILGDNVYIGSNQHTWINNLFASEETKKKAKELDESVNKVMDKIKEAAVELNSSSGTENCRALISIAILEANKIKLELKLLCNSFIQNANTAHPPFVANGSMAPMPSPTFFNPSSPIRPHNPGNTTSASSRTTAANPASWPANSLPQRAPLGNLQFPPAAPRPLPYAPIRVSPPQGGYVGQVNSAPARPPFNPSIPFMGPAVPFQAKATPPTPQSSAGKQAAPTTTTSSSSSSAQAASSGGKKRKAVANERTTTTEGTRRSERTKGVRKSYNPADSDSDYEPSKKSAESAKRRKQ